MKSPKKLPKRKRDGTLQQQPRCFTGLIPVDVRLREKSFRLGFVIGTLGGVRGRGVGLYFLK